MLNYVPGGQEAFAGAMDNTLNEFQQNKLKMALMNNQIEQEQKSKLAEAQAMKEMNTISGEQFSGLASVFGVKPEKTAALANLFPGGIDKGVAENFISAEGRAARAEATMNKPVHIAGKPDSNGIVQQGFMQPLTGQWVTPPTQTLRPDWATKIAASQEGTKSTLAIIDGMQQRLQKVLTQVPGYVPGQEANIKLNSLIPYDPQLKATMDGQAGRVLQISKQLQGTAGRNWEMIKAEMQGYGDGSDTVESMNQKLNDKKQDIMNTNAATLQAYDPSNFLKSQQHPLSVGQQQGVESMASKDPQTRYHQLVLQGKSKEQAYAQMHAEGL